MVRFTENDKKNGSCVNLVIDYVCSDGWFWIVGL